jgi:hypothetical protein
MSQLPECARVTTVANVRKAYLPTVHDNDSTRAPKDSRVADAQGNRHAQRSDWQFAANELHTAASRETRVLARLSAVRQVQNGDGLQRRFDILDTRRPSAPAALSFRVSAPSTTADRSHRERRSIDASRIVERRPSRPRACSPNYARHTEPLTQGRVRMTAMSETYEFYDARAARSTFTASCCCPRVRA